MRSRLVRCVLCFAAFLIAAPRGYSYSVLTHEAIIDSLWKSHIREMLLQRFPGTSEDELHMAHAYVYGGCVIQDMGYAPFANRLFSDLGHYMRSGDFVSALIKDSTNVDEYAFALGSLAHYASDSVGHPAINQIEPQIYPKLAAKYGKVVTYEDSPTDHIKTEFSLDVIQIARGLYAPDALHDFIGFEVAQDLLDRAFLETYGVRLKDLVSSEDLAIGTYRFAAGKLIPEATKIAWDSKRKDIEKLSPGIERSKFVYALPARQYRKNWGNKYKQPGILERFASFLFRLMPTFGPFKALRFRPVPPNGEQMFLKSFDATVDRYRNLLEQARAGNLKLPNVNLDTGSPTRAGDYRLADRAYISLLDKLANSKYATVTPELKANLIQYVDEMDRSKVPAKTAAQLNDLRGTSLGPQPASRRNR